MQKARYTGCTCCCESTDTEDACRKPRVQKLDGGPHFLAWLGTWARSPTGNIVNPNQWISQRGEPVAVCQSILEESRDLPNFKVRLLAVRKAR